MARSRRELQAMADMMTGEAYGRLPRDEKGQVIPSAIPAEWARECESCAEGGQHGVPATCHSSNPDWSGYDLCDECRAEYDSREHI
jgi:hypothetical protein